MKILGVKPGEIEGVIGSSFWADTRKASTEARNRSRSLRPDRTKRGWSSNYAARTTAGRYGLGGVQAGARRQVYPQQVPGHHRTSSVGGGEQAA
jgi:hypothetical protein